MLYTCDYVDPFPKTIVTWYYGDLFPIFMFAWTPCKHYLEYSSINHKQL